MKSNKWENALKAPKKGSCGWRLSGTESTISFLTIQLSLENRNCPSMARFFMRFSSLLCVAANTITLLRFKVAYLI